MYKYFFTYIFLILPLSLMAFNPEDKSTLKGCVKDSITNEVLPFASVQILKKGNPSFSMAEICNNKGEYTLKDIPYGDYVLHVSYMGYHEKERHISLNKKKHIHHFLMTKKSMILDEVSVTAEKKVIEKSIEKTSINVSKDISNAGGTAYDVLQKLPSVDIDMDGNINYRGSDKLLLLINGEKSQLINTLNQIAAERIEKIELINNPSAKYDAEGMSGIINIKLKKAAKGENKTTLILNAGLPETLGSNVGYTHTNDKTRLYLNAGVKRQRKDQTKTHLRENIDKPNTADYYQLDHQNQYFNDAFLSSDFDYKFNNKRKLGIGFSGSKALNNAIRDINYETLLQEELIQESKKDIDIHLNNYSVEGGINYHHLLNKGRYLYAKFYYTQFEQFQEMNHVYYPNISVPDQDLQNTYSEQKNNSSGFRLDYFHPIKDSISFETGYVYSSKNLFNAFSSESKTDQDIWNNDTDLASDFNYIQDIHAAYFDFKSIQSSIHWQAGLRTEWSFEQNSSTQMKQKLSFFPSLNISSAIHTNYTLFANYNRRINRPTIKMLNPFSLEYADNLNVHKGNPELDPEYVNSFEAGTQYRYKKFSGSLSIYHRNINQAISRLKSASNDSALYVSYINLDKAKLTGVELYANIKLINWWELTTTWNIFNTELLGTSGNNFVDKQKNAWNIKLLNSFRIKKDLKCVVSAFYRSKLPSVMGIYIPRYYADFAVSKSLFRNNAQLIFKISDVFDSYLFGLNVDAIDSDSYRYTQTNRRKISSRYFTLSFIYNIKPREQAKKTTNFYLDTFDKK